MKYRANKITVTDTQINRCANCNLKKICFPAGLSSSELDTFEDSVNKTFKIPKKQKLFSRDEPLTAFYAIKAGGMKTQLSTSDNQTQIIGFHLPGDLLGFDGFAESKHTCDAIALEDTILCELSVGNFDSLCETLPGIRKVMMQQVGEVMNKHYSLALTLGQMSSETRLATYLYKLSYYYKSRGYSSTEFNLPMSRSDLASYLGMAPETLSRTFSKLDKQKVLNLKKRNVTIIDNKALTEMSHELCIHDD